MAATKQQRLKASEAVLFGQSLRRFRNARDWSQERLAEAAGITLNYVGNLERGEQGPSLNVLVRLAKALEMDVPTLLADFRRDVVRKMNVD